MISFLDVGQGDATLIQLDRTAVLVDTGPPDGPILRRLKETGIQRLDALMLTHAEADHEGAAPQVIAAYHPRLVVDGGAGWPSRVQRVLASAARSVHAPAAGETIAVGALRFDVLWPPPRAPSWLPTGNPNDNALVTRLEAAGLTVLLTADAESNVLTPLAPGPVDVLKVSHHGSKDEGLPQLLAAAAPADRGDRGRPPQHLRPPGAVDARGAERQSRRWCGPTATARSACTPPTAGCGCSDEPVSADGHAVNNAAHAAARPAQPLVTEPSPIRPVHR